MPIARQESSPALSARERSFSKSSPSEVDDPRTSVGPILSRLSRLSPLLDEIVVTRSPQRRWGRTRHRERARPAPRWR